VCESLPSVYPGTEVVRWILPLRFGRTPSSGSHWRPMWFYSRGNPRCERAVNLFHWKILRSHLACQVNRGIFRASEPLIEPCVRGGRICCSFDGSPALGPVNTSFFTRRVFALGSEGWRSRSDIRRKADFSHEIYSGRFIGGRQWVLCTRW